MTTTEFLTLPTREQDALVAEKVMGIKLDICDGGMVEDDCGWKCSDCSLEGFWAVPLTGEHVASPKRYATDISAA